MTDSLQQEGARDIVTSAVPSNLRIYLAMKTAQIALSLLPRVSGVLFQQLYLHATFFVVVFVEAKTVPYYFHHPRYQHHSSQPPFFATRHKSKVRRSPNSHPHREFCGGT